MTAKTPLFPTSFNPLSPLPRLLSPHFLPFPSSLFLFLLLTFPSTVSSFFLSPPSPLAVLISFLFFSYFLLTVSFFSLSSLLLLFLSSLRYSIFPSPFSSLPEFTSIFSFLFPFSPIRYQFPLFLPFPFPLHQQPYIPICN